MAFSAPMNEVLKLWWVIPILLLAAALQTSWFKGWVGEASVKLAARVRLPSDIYRQVHNVTAQTPDGTTQVDHIFVSRFGIFVVETKNMQGWIFGGADQAQWTQTIFRKSFKFQNPIRQNYKHVKAVEATLDVPPGTIHSVVVFTGESTFKSSMPPNVTSGGGFVRYIKSFREPVLSEPAVRGAVARIQSSRLEPSREVHRSHVQQLRTRVDSPAVRICPKCASKMVLRTARRGAGAGSQFWGCSAYPRCRVTQDVT